MKRSLVLALPATVLQATATTLRLAAAVGERLADVLKPGSSAAPAPVSPPAPAPSRARASASAAPATPAPAIVREAPDSAAAPLNVSALAAKPAPDVLAALEGLSSEELADLYDHESNNRRRRIVLDAVEAAAAPPAEVRTPEPLPADDVRLEDELVYSTETPRR